MQLSQILSLGEQYYAGEAVGVSVSAFAKGLVVFEVEYCARSYLQRRITIDGSQAIAAESFKSLTENAKSGVSYYSEIEQIQAET